MVLGRLAAAALIALTMTGCGGGGTTGPGPDPTYEELVSSAWDALADGDLDAAIEAFIAARTSDPTQAEPHSGLGWCRIFLDDPEAADVDFAAGATLAGDDAVQADLQAGRALVANALKDPDGIDTSNFSESNARIDATLALEPNWSFGPLPGLDADELFLLRAANHFALSDFAASLAAVQLLDELFSVDVGTEAGIAALAAKIEELGAAGVLRPVLRLTGVAR